MDLCNNNCWNSRPSQENSCVMEFLPTDLAHDIFLRLPCKDIVRSKCVCKEWYELLSDPSFSSNYRRNSLFTSSFFIQRRDGTNSVFLLEFAANGGVIKTPIKPKVPDFQQIHMSLCIIGSCNGLLFLWMSSLNHNNRIVEKVYCCNPLLEGSVALAEHEREYQPYFVECFLGYISSTNKFKLLRVIFQGFEKVEQADIFTVGTDRKWRRVEDALNMGYRPRGVSFNGAYLWFVKHENLRYISSFDFREEKNGRISKLPDLLQHKWRIDLVVLNNHLSVIDVSDCFQITVWTMKEYGVAESWCRNILIRDWYPENPQVADLYAIAALPNGDILFSDYVSGNIMSLNPEKEHTEIKVNDFKTVSTLHAAEFTPRFYSLNEDIRGRKYRNTRNICSRILCLVLLGSALLLYVK